MNGTFQSTEHLLTGRLSNELRSGERFVAGAAGRTNTNILPQSFSFTGAYLALTTDRLLLFDYDRLTSRPAKLRDQLSVKIVSGDSVSVRAKGRGLSIRVDRIDENFFDLVFSGREKAAARTIATILKSSVEGEA